MKIIIQGNGWNPIIARLNLVIIQKTPFLVATAALLNKIMPIALSHDRALFCRFSLQTDKGLNAEKTVGQVSRTNATVEDHNFVT